MKREKRVSSIELIVLDVDGTMTDGRIIYSESGDEIKAFNVRDGLGIASWIRLGKKAAIITGRSSKIVEKRAKELGIVHYYQGVNNKLGQLETLIKELELDWEQVAVIGDDLNDYAMLSRAGISFLPRGGCNVLEKIADITLQREGGDGAVREMVDYLIDREGLREELYRLWGVE